MDKVKPTLIVNSAVILGLFALVSVLLLGLIQWQTQDRIEENTRQRKLANLEQIIPQSAYDSDLLKSEQVMSVISQGLDETVRHYTVYSKGIAVAQLYEVVSTQGYSGTIRLLIGIDGSNAIKGVRVIAHQETPGLGDKIELSKDDWILQFNGKSLQSPNESGWKVKKDGGAFDQFTGATITPRAVINAIRETLRLHVTREKPNV